MSNKWNQNVINWGGQDGGGVGGCGAHLSPWIHQDTPSDTEVMQNTS